MSLFESFRHSLEKNLSVEGFSQLISGKPKPDDAKSSNQQEATKRKTSTSTSGADTEVDEDEKRDMFEENMTSADVRLRHLRLAKQRSIDTAFGQIQPHLYVGQGSSDDSALGSSKGASKVGQLKWALLYDFQTSDFVVIIRKVDFNGAAGNVFSCCVKLYLSPQSDVKPRRTVTVRCRSNAVSFADETFKFGVTFDDVHDRTLNLEVWQISFLKKESLIGTVAADLRDLDIVSAPDIVSDIYSNKDSNVGSILVSLAYLPAAERLTISVIKAKNLKAMDITGSSDPYVRGNLFNGDRCLKRRQTTVKRRSLCPEWNETLTFDVSQRMLKNTSVELLVLDKDQIGLDEVIGRVLLSANADSFDTKEQWNSSILAATPGPSVWHQLQHVESPTFRQSLTSSVKEKLEFFDPRRLFSKLSISREVP